MILAFSFFLCTIFADYSFLSIGDWGGQDSAPYYTPGQKLAADNGMPRAADVYDAKLVLALGDNFYGSGIHGDETDPRFEETFESVYNNSSLQVPFYVVAGNHDHMHNVTAQIFYSNHSSRWTFPDLYYTFTETFQTASGERTAQWILIDTVIFSGLSYHEEETGEFVEPLGPLDQEAADSQFAWLEKEIEQS